MRRATENPGIIERTPPDAHARTPCLLLHSTGGFRRGDVAVTDHGDRVDGVHDGTDTGKIDAPGEALRARPAMHKDRGDAGVLEHAREIRRGEVLIVPAE